jgi:hypothetical protein
MSKKNTLKKQNNTFKKQKKIQIKIKSFKNKPIIIRKTKKKFGGVLNEADFKDGKEFIAATEKEGTKEGYEFTSKNGKMGYYKTKPKKMEVGYEETYKKKDEEQKEYEPTKEGETPSNEPKKFELTLNDLNLPNIESVKADEANINKSLRKINDHLNYIVKIASKPDLPEDDYKEEEKHNDNLKSCLEENKKEDDPENYEKNIQDCVKRKGEKGEGEKGEGEKEKGEEEKKGEEREGQEGEKTPNKYIKEVLEKGKQKVDYLKEVLEKGKQKIDYLKENAKNAVKKLRNEYDPEVDYYMPYTVDEGEPNELRTKIKRFKSGKKRVVRYYTKISDDRFYEKHKDKFKKNGVGWYDSDLIEYNLDDY